MPRKLVDNADSDAVLGLRSAEQILDEQLVLIAQRSQKVGLQRGEMRRAHRRIIVPPDIALGFGVADDILVVGGPPGVATCFDHQRSVGG